MDANKLVNRLGSRRFVEDLLESMSEVAEVIEERGKGSKGKVTVTFEMENAGDHQITVNEHIKQNLPETVSRGALFYSFNGTLFDRDPRETPLVYETVDAPAPNVRHVDPETGEIREPQMQAAPVREV